MFFHDFKYLKLHLVLSSYYFFDGIVFNGRKPIAEAIIGYFYNPKDLDRIGVLFSEICTHFSNNF